MEEYTCTLCGCKSRILIEYENVYVNGRKLILCYDCYDLNVRRRRTCESEREEDDAKH